MSNRLHIQSTHHSIPEQDSAQAPAPDVLAAILRAYSGLRFGSIEITVHEGKVTQIERREKIRLNSTTDRDSGRQHVNLTASR